MLFPNPPEPMGFYVTVENTGLTPLLRGEAVQYPGEFVRLPSYDWVDEGIVAFEGTADQTIEPGQYGLVRLKRAWFV